MKDFPTLDELKRPIDHDYKRRVAEIFNSISNQKKHSNIHPILTLCDVCENACGSCEWSEKWVQKPVPGWDAVRRDVSNETTIDGKRIQMLVESYIVLRCPKFVLEEKWAASYARWDPEKRREKLK